MAEPSIPIRLIRDALAIELRSQRRTERKFAANTMAKDYIDTLRQSQLSLINTLQEITGNQILRRRKNG